MNTLFLVLKLFPLILGTIQQIEVVAPIPKAGAAKLKLITDTVSAAYKADPTTTSAIPQDSLVPLIQSVASNAVNFFNVVGLFKKTL